MSIFSLGSKSTVFLKVPVVNILFSLSTAIAVLSLLQRPSKLFAHKLLPSLSNFMINTSVNPFYWRIFSFFESMYIVASKYPVIHIFSSESTTQDTPLSMEVPLNDFAQTN